MRDKMKFSIVATNGSNLIAESEKNSYVFNSKGKVIANYTKKENPTFIDACVAKWGYVFLDRAVPLDSLENIPKEIINKALNNPALKSAVYR